MLLVFSGEICQMLVSHIFILEQENKMFDDTSGENDETTGAIYNCY